MIALPTTEGITLNPWLYAILLSLAVYGALQLLLCGVHALVRRYVVRNINPIELPREQREAVAAALKSYIDAQYTGIDKATAERAMWNTIYATGPVQLDAKRRIHLKGRGDDPDDIHMTYLD